jgi:hypothetical protein
MKPIDRVAERELRVSIGAKRNASAAPQQHQRVRVTARDAHRRTRRQRGNHCGTRRACLGAVAEPSVRALTE